MHPNVPRSPIILGQVGAQIAVVELALNEFAHGAIELGAEFGIAAINPGQRGGVNPFADVFAVPCLPARPLAKTFQQSFRIDGEQPIDVAVDPRADHAGQMRGAWRLDVLPVGHGANDLVRNRGGRRGTSNPRT